MHRAGASPLWSGKSEPQLSGWQLACCRQSPSVLRGGCALGLGVTSVQKHLWLGQPMFSLSAPGLLDDREAETLVL